MKYNLRKILEERKKDLNGYIIDYEAQIKALEKEW